MIDGGISDKMVSFLPEQPAVEAMLSACCVESTFVHKPCLHPLTFTPPSVGNDKSKCLQRIIQMTCLLAVYLWVFHYLSHNFV